MRRLFAAALASRGKMEAILRALCISEEVLSQRLSMLRRHGVARTLTLYDPGASGRPFHSVILVRLRHHSLTAIADFEAACIADEAVTAAVSIAGSFDYRLTAFHPDARQAAAWVRGMKDRAEIFAVDHQVLRIVFGHGLDGIPLTHGCHDPVE
jgi:DNA-binding Lrp family transcriptional regulator